MGFFLESLLKLKICKIERYESNHLSNIKCISVELVIIGNWNTIFTHEIDSLSDIDTVIEFHFIVAFHGIC